MCWVEIQVQLCFSSNQQSVAEGDSWPVTVGVRKQGPATSFDVLVKLATTRDSLCFTSPMGQQPPPFASRKASDVHFVDGEMRVLFLPIFRSCDCVDASGMPSTSCSHALDPDCHDFTNPSLGEFDEDNLPHLPASAKSP